MRWYHEGLNAFECNLEGGNELLRQFGRAVHDLALEFPVADRAAAEQELADLLKKTTAARREIRRLLEQGRDRLLELNSFRPATAQKIIGQIQEQERQPDLENYLLDVFDHFGVHIEELAPHTWQLNPQGIITDSFPSMPAEGMVATCDRRRALSREDVGFLTWDHPMVTGAMDLLLGAETGNCSFAVLPTANERTMLLELIFVLEAIAAPRLHADRFLPLTPVRLVVSHKLEDVSEAFCGTTWERKLQKGSPYKLIENAEIARRTLPAMFQTAAHAGRDQGRSTAPVRPQRNEPPARPRGGAPANARAGERSRSPGGNQAGASTAGGVGDCPPTIPSPAGLLATHLERSARSAEVNGVESGSIVQWLLLTRLPAHLVAQS